MRTPRVLLLLLSVGLVLTACGDTQVLGSDLPRTTENGITITVTETEELHILMGCHEAWVTGQGEEPPPGTCEQMTTIRRFIAQHGSASVETRVVGDFRVDPLYAMDRLSGKQADGISIVVVAPPPGAATIRLVNSVGEVLDRTRPTGALVALAAMDEHPDVEALSNEGIVIAACPHDGVTINDVTYSCTIAANATAPVTTHATSDTGTPTSQQAALEDGEVTFAEYESAVLATMSCLRDAGVEVFDIGRTPDGRHIEFSFGRVPDQERLALEQAVYDECRAVHSGSIEDHYTLQNAPTQAEIDEQVEQAADCMRSRGMDVPVGVAEQDFPDLIPQNPEVAIPCLQESGF